MSDCRHLSIHTSRNEEHDITLWACDDCQRRFYPACEQCVSIGHRGGHAEHPAPSFESGSSEPSTEAGRRLVRLIREEARDGDGYQAEQAKAAYRLAARTAEFVIPQIEAEARAASPKGEPAFAQAAAPDEIVNIAAHALCHGKSCDGGHDGDSICPPHGEAALAFAAAYADADREAGDGR